jgi:hypothetical protein
MRDISKKHLNFIKDVLFKKNTFATFLALLEGDAPGDVLRKRGATGVDQTLVYLGLIEYNDGVYNLSSKGVELAKSIDGFIKAVNHSLPGV